MSDGVKVVPAYVVEQLEQHLATAIQERDAAQKEAERLLREVVDRNARALEGDKATQALDAVIADNDALRQRNEELTAALGLLREAYIGAKRMRQSDFDDIDRLLKEQS